MVGDKPFESSFEQRQPHALGASNRGEVDGHHRVFFIEVKM